MTNGTVPKKLDTTRQAMEFGAALLKQAPHLTPEEMQYWIKNQGLLQDALAKALVIPDPRREWVRFYNDIFGINADYFSDLALPKKQVGFNWLIVMHRGFTEQILIEACKKRFKVQCSIKDKDLIAIKSTRTNDKTYAFWVRDRIEADDENKNKSANDCEREGINGITLPERLLLELWYHWKTGKHLDIENYTLCSGSRIPAGHVPRVTWHAVELEVRYDGYLDSRSDNYRARAVVSA